MNLQCKNTIHGDVPGCACPDSKLQRRWETSPDQTYKNPRVNAVIHGGLGVTNSWTAEDYLALALAAIDQAGYSAEVQARIERILQGSAVRS